MSEVIFPPFPPHLICTGMFLVHLSAASKNDKSLFLWCSVSVSIPCTDGSLCSHMRKTILCHVSFSFVLLQINQKCPPILFCTLIGSRAGLFDRLLNETTKRTGTLGVTQPACLLLNGEHAGTFPQWGFFKRACTAVPNKGSTVGQLPVELQPLFCGGVGQIRPHNCLSSQTVTAASLRPLKSTTDCCSFGEPSGKKE